MATRRKLKKQVYFVLGGLIILIVGICFAVKFYQNYQYQQTYEYKLLKHGYNDTEVARILKEFNDEEHLN